MSLLASPNSISAIMTIINPTNMAIILPVSPPIVHAVVVDKQLAISFLYVVNRIGNNLQLSEWLLSWLIVVTME